MKQITTMPFITPDTLILEIVEHYPQTVAVFNAFDMACPGCHISSFHTIAESAHEYGLCPDTLLRALNDVLASIAISR